MIWRRTHEIMYHSFSTNLCQRSYLIKSCLDFYSIISPSFPPCHLHNCQLPLPFAIRWGNAGEVVRKEEYRETEGWIGRTWCGGGRREQEAWWEVWRWGEGGQWRQRVGGLTRTKTNKEEEEWKSDVKWGQDGNIGQQQEEESKGRTQRRKGAIINGWKDVACRWYGEMSGGRSLCTRGSFVSPCIFPFPLTFTCFISWERWTLWRHETPQTRRSREPQRRKQTRFTLVMSHVMPRSLLHCFKNNPESLACL